MQTNTKSILIFLGGAATGALISFALLHDKYKQLMDEEITSMKEYYNKEKEDLEESHFKEMRSIVKDYEVEEEEKKTFVDYVKKYNPSEIVADKDYNRPYPIDDEEDDMPPPEDPPERTINFSEPYVISLEEFEEENHHFDKITISYYDIDDTLADEREEIITDVEVVIGEDALGRFGDMSGDPNIVFVRNERLGADYEICLMSDSYAESVLGIIDDEPKKHKRRGIDG